MAGSFLLLHGCNHNLEEWREGEEKAGHFALHDLFCGKTRKGEKRT